MTPAAIAPPNIQTSIDKFVADLFTPERLKANPQCLLHSFLAKDAAQLVAPTLARWKTDKSIADKINLQVTDYRLSPLHIAVLKGNRQAASILTEHGASLSSQDIHGCTPLHLAAMLQNQEMLQQLKETAEKTDRAALAVRNSSYDTFEILQESLQNPPKIVPDHIVSYYAKENSVTPLTAAAFRALTKTEYCSTILITREILWKRWQKLPKKVKPIDPEVQMALHNYHAHQPKLILGEEVAANGSFSIGLGVKAGESLAKGQIVRIFAGELDVDLDSKYAVASEDGTIEPIRYGNETSRINDGFPNCGRISVGYKKYVIALEPIAQNE
ncbi:MAG: ankyrin repeat domain-containing protein [Parachlamydia sp.]|nr:ankyrin repeat domain-containing protein [Parachlamydia sp.]